MLKNGKMGKCGEKKRKGLSVKNMRNEEKRRI